MAKDEEPQRAGGRPGLPAVSATTRPGRATHDPAAWASVKAGVWTAAMVAALENGVRGGRWYSLLDKVWAPRTLAAAWERVAANAGAAGVDGVSVERFRGQAARYLAELSAALQAGTYRPLPVRRVEIPKGNGETRPRGIPAVKDRVVQAALVLVLEPIFEWEFLPESYGFRAGRRAKDALRMVDGLVKAGYAWVVDADLKGDFDSIPHEPLVARVAERVADGGVLRLVRQFLEQDILDGLEQWTPTTGTPQGAVVSPLLANLYLHPLDVVVTQAGYRLVRYADDFVILCRSAAEAEAALVLVQEWTTANGLTLHPTKTRIGDCRERGQGFEFLGYRFEAGRRTVRRKSLRAVKDRIRAKTKRSRGNSLQQIIVDLNRTLVGWFGYFRHAHPRVYRTLDQFIRRRLRAVLRKQEKRPGAGRCLADHRRWPNAYFAAQGLFTLTTAHAQLCHPR